MTKIFNLVQNQRQVFLIISNFDPRFYIIAVLRGNKSNKCHPLLIRNQRLKIHFNNNKWHLLYSVSLNQYKEV